jgi:hypothetical protein
MRRAGVLPALLRSRFSSYQAGRVSHQTRAAPTNPAHQLGEIVAVEVVHLLDIHAAPPHPQGHTISVQASGGVYPINCPVATHFGEPGWTWKSFTYSAPRNSGAQRMWLGSPGTCPDDRQKRHRDGCPTQILRMTRIT